MQLVLTQKYLNGLQLLHFITEIENYKILKFLLEQSNAVNITEISKETKIPKGVTKRRLQKFVKNHLCDVTLDIPKYENQRPTKSYRLMYMIKTQNKLPLNLIVDVLENAGVRL